MRFSSVSLSRAPALPRSVEAPRAPEDSALKDPDEYVSPELPPLALNSPDSFASGDGKRFALPHVPDEWPTSPVAALEPVDRVDLRFGEPAGPESPAPSALPQSGDPSTEELPWTHSPIGQLPVSPVDGADPVASSPSVEEFAAVLRRVGESALSVVSTLSRPSTLTRSPQRSFLRYSVVLAGKSQQTARKAKHELDLAFAGLSPPLIECGEDWYTNKGASRRRRCDGIAIDALYLDNVRAAAAIVKAERGRGGAVGRPKRKAAD